MVFAAVTAPAAPSRMRAPTVRPVLAETVMVLLPLLPVAVVPNL